MVDFQVLRDAYMVKNGITKPEDEVIMDDEKLDSMYEKLAEQLKEE